jgi:hypothetical protein
VVKAAASEGSKEGLKVEGELGTATSSHHDLPISPGDQCAFELSSGLAGVGEHHIQSGDVIVLAHSSDFPLVLRPHLKCFRFVGCAYVWGPMQGDMRPEEEEDTKSLLTRLIKFQPDKALRGDETGLLDVFTSTLTGFSEQAKDREFPANRNMELEEFVLI